MTIALAATSIGLIALLGYVLRLSASKEREWARERQLLITRIQHPEIVVTEPEKAIPDDMFLTSEPDDAHLVGTIQTGAPNGD